MKNIAEMRGEGGDVPERNAGRRAWAAASAANDVRVKTSRPVIRAAMLRIIGASFEKGEWPLAPAPVLTFLARGSVGESHPPRCSTGDADEGRATRSGDAGRSAHPERNGGVRPRVDHLPALISGAQRAALHDWSRSRFGAGVTRARRACKDRPG